MVYDGYYGGFVPVEAASFDVSLEGDAVAMLPLSSLDEQRSTAEERERRQQARVARRARPRCDARDHHVQAVTRARDGLLALCAVCACGLDLAALDSEAVIEALVTRVPEGPQRRRRRRALEGRLSARRHERDVTSGGVGRCPLCGRFRRVLATRDGVLQACRGCAQGLPLGELEGAEVALALLQRRSPPTRSAFLAQLAVRFPGLPHSGSMAPGPVAPVVEGSA